MIIPSKYRKRFISGAILFLSAILVSVFILPLTTQANDTKFYCIELTKVGPEEPVVPGQEITYTYDVFNACDFDLVDFWCYDNPLGPLVWGSELEMGESLTIEKTHIITAEDCVDGQFTNKADCAGDDAGGIFRAESAFAYWTAFCETCDPSGTGTPGYWKNHLDAWPVDYIEIGGVTYSIDEAALFLNSAVKKDKTITMFKALVAAKLNLEDCNAGNCIKETVQLADEWMLNYGPVGSGVMASSPEWQIGEQLYVKLDAYNNGILCAPARDQLEL